MKYIDRKGNITIEENSQDKLLRHLYNDRGGRLCLKLLIRPFVSKAAGIVLNTRLSARFVPVYQNYLKELRECRMMNRRHPSSGQGTEQKGMKPQPKPVLTDAEVERQIKGRFAQSRKILDVREKYYDEFRKILSPKQIMKIYRTEQNNADKLKKEFDRRKKQAVAQGKHKHPVRSAQKS